VKAEAKTNVSVKVSAVYKVLHKYIKDRFVNSIDISENEVKISIIHLIFEDYLEFIKAIESGTDFKIIDMQPPIKKEVGLENIMTIKYIK
jgi:hypothetical protein